MKKLAVTLIPLIFVGTRFAQSTLLLVPKPTKPPYCFCDPIPTR